LVPQPFVAEILGGNEPIVINEPSSAD
jgi:FtsP/CotA-like multicopper oxidase with cupredoxin domain